MTALLEQFGFSPAAMQALGLILALASYCGVPVLVVFILAVRKIIDHREGRHFQTEGGCRRCGYPLAHLPRRADGVHCPECGEVDHTA